MWWITLVDFQMLNQPWITWHISHQVMLYNTFYILRPIPGILQARTLEWVPISFSSAWKWKVKVKSLSCVWLLSTPWTAAYQAPLPMGFSRQECWSGLPLPSPKSNLTIYKKYYSTWLSGIYIRLFKAGSQSRTQLKRLSSSSSSSSRFDLLMFSWEFCIYVNEKYWSLFFYNAFVQFWC